MSFNGESEIMRRIGILAAIVVVGAVTAGQAHAQILGPTFIGPIGPTYVGPGYMGPGYVAPGSSSALRRELRRQAAIASALRHRDRDRWRDDHDCDPRPPVVILPPAVRPSTDPFRGSPNGANYFYWLSREYAKGRVSKSEYNRQVYGIGR
jgi:hypothetical protein